MIFIKVTTIRLYKAVLYKVEKVENRLIYE